jgi:hypothetical protein
MAKAIMLEVIQPYHKSGTEVLYQPGHLFPLGHPDVPADARTREVVVDVPDGPPPVPKAEDKPAARTAPAAKAPAAEAAAKPPARG